MGRFRFPRRTRPRGRAVLLATALALTATGCVTVHGERLVVPVATPAEAADALRAFTTAYNAADKAYDPALGVGRVTGPLGAINQAGLRARSVNFPDGNPEHVPLELTDATFTIPKKAGWPRYFLADTDSNRDDDKSAADNRWVLVFLRNAPGQPWRAAYLSILSPGQIPALRKDADGHGVPVPADSTAFAHRPAALSRDYVAYLTSGRPDHFRDGPHTSDWRADRRQDANRPGKTTQYIDQAVTGGDYAPLGLVTADGDALVFFTVRTFERETAAPGVALPVTPDVRALLTGQVRSSLTKERVSSQAVVVPKAPGGKVTVLGRITGLTAAKGS
ncbi:hypothetical protein ACFVIM_16925 [Streptomyces sp. NPDC057638]|uniref:hypothetical protein n=1 Tax=Streptomyces sp. NPDC057638 TaxID=3346190 RepID=UPI0036BD8831